MQKGGSSTPPTFKRASIQFLGGPWDGALLPIDPAYHPPDSLWIRKRYREFSLGEPGAIGFVVHPSYVSANPDKNPATAHLSGGPYDLHALLVDRNGETGFEGVYCYVWYQINQWNMVSQVP